jgi:hypothetical protein
MQQHSIFIEQQILFEIVPQKTARKIKYLCSMCCTKNPMIIPNGLKFTFKNLQKVIF